MSVYLCKAFLLVVLGVTSQVADVEAVRALPREYVDDIETNADDVERILEYLTKGDGKHVTYNRLAEFVDKFGSRFTGTQTLEDSIDYMALQLRNEGFAVYTEDVEVPAWVRGEESARLISPREVDLYVMGLMHSISTQGTLELEAIVVKSFDELYERRDEAKDKIVVYNQAWTDYIDGYVYRTTGASHASNVGAKAALIRSVTDFSIYTPHTGSQSFWPNVTKIPSACITTEDAEMLQRMQDQGDNITIRFEATHQDLDMKISRNLYADIEGSELKDEYVLFGGHIDSWDVGVGAMDDGGGIMVTRQILSTIKHLGLRPKRTLRLVMWTAEEIGILGGKAFFEKHKEELDRVSFAMESDFGTFSPTGLNMHNASGLARAIVEEILERFMGGLGASMVGEGGLGKADIGDWIRHGVPGASLETENDKYFFFHHTEGDTMTVEDPDELDRCSALFTVAAYVIANLEEKLPREGEYPDDGQYPPASVAAPIIYHNMGVIAAIILHLLK